MPSKNYTAKCRIWIEATSGTFLAEGRIALLKKINDLGSISKAAKSMNMSYSKAWEQINLMNNSAQKSMITKIVGGKQGGGTQVTEYGKKMIVAYDKLNQSCKEFLNLEIQKLNL